MRARRLRVHVDGARARKTGVDRRSAPRRRPGVRRGVRRDAGSARARDGVIRAARVSDHDAIVAVTHAAFDGEEEALRVVRELEPEISLVWEEDGEIFGHTMLTRMEMGAHRPFQLSPLSVAPSHQGRGIGSALTREALRLADQTGRPGRLGLRAPDLYPPPR